ncbi:MAG: heavy metal translocating P-type ATPase [Treponema sp.]|nr:heavy metal translocating P-type ATPase [Treponema sp.]
MTRAQVYGDAQKVHALFHDFYFEGAAMILTLITVGKMLEARSKGKTTNALKALMKLSPKTACVLRDDKEVTIPIEEIIVGDIFLVRPGESLPVDGILVEGSGAVNESALTGESVPVDKKAGDKVYSATINQSGFLKCKATRVGQDTTLSQIIKMVGDAAATKAPAQKVADKVSGIFVPTVITIAIVTTVIWLLLGKEFGFALARGISVLVISCPCALGLATPVAIMVGNGVGAKNGILFKTAAALEQTGKTKAIALDKTGTITKGEPVVTDIFCAQGVGEQELLQAALDIESKSEHPLAKAVLQKASELSLEARPVQDFKALAGSGVMAKDQDQNELLAASVQYVNEKIALEKAALDAAENFSSQGKTPLAFVRQNKLLGIIAVADVIKEDSALAIKELKALGIKTVMLTGDNQKTAAFIAKQAGVDQVIAEVLPEQKAAAVQELKKSGEVAMVGDGINDAVALTSADIGIAIGAGADVAVDAADLVLVKNSLMDVVTAIRLSRATLRNIRQNLFWAFIYNVIGIPLAAGAWIWLLGWKMNPMFGAAAMSLSSFCVVSNALRLNFFKANKSVNQVSNINNSSKECNMKKTLKVEGLMCEHCDARVKKALEAVPGVSSASADHTKGEAVVELSGDVSDDALKAAVEAQDYKVLGIN